MLNWRPGKYPYDQNRAHQRKISALETVKTSNNFNRMGDKKRFQRTAVVGVFGAMIGLGAHSSVTEKEFVPPSYTYREERQVQAYVPVMRVTTPALKLADNLPYKGEALRDAARVWQKEYSLGRLTEMFTKHPQDSIHEGVKEQIYSARHELIKSLREQAEVDAQKGDHKKAQEDLLLALDVCQVMKYAETMSVSLTCKYQSEILERLSATFKDSDLAFRQAFFKRIGKIEAEPVSPEEFLTALNMPKNTSFVMKTHVVASSEPMSFKVGSRITKGARFPSSSYRALNRLHDYCKELTKNLN